MDGVIEEADMSLDSIGRTAILHDPTTPLDGPAFPPPNGPPSTPSNHQAPPVASPLNTLASGHRHHPPSVVNKGKKGQDTSKMAFFTVAGSFKLNLAQAWRLEVRTRHHMIRTRPVLRDGPLLQGHERYLPRHLLTLLSLINDHHQKLAIFNYEASDLLSKHVASMIDGRLPISAFKNHTWNAALMAVSKREAGELRGRPTLPPGFAPPPPPPHLKFLVQLLDDCKVYLMSSLRMDKKTKLPSPTFELPAIELSKQDSAATIEESNRPNCDIWLPPASPPLPNHTRQLPYQALVTLKEFLVHIVALGPTHTFHGCFISWKLKNLHNLCSAIEPLWRDYLDAFTRVFGTKTQDSKTELEDAMKDLLCLCNLFETHQPHCYIDEKRYLYRPLFSTGAWSSSIQLQDKIRGHPPNLSRSCLSEPINERGAELAVNTMNHIVLNLRSRVTSYLHWRLRHLPKKEQNPLVHSIIKALFSLAGSLDPNEHKIDNAEALNIYTELVNFIKSIPLVRWETSDSLLPLRDDACFKDDRLVPQLLHLFRHFEDEYRTDPDFTVLPQEPGYVPIIDEKKKKDKKNMNEDDKKAKKDQEAQTDNRPHPKTSFMHFSLLPRGNFDGFMMNMDCRYIWDVVKSMQDQDRQRFRNFDPNPAADRIPLFLEILRFTEADGKQIPHPQAGVKTDGTSIRLCYVDPRREKSRKELNAKAKFEADIKVVKGLFNDCKPNETIHVIGFDPGRKRPGTWANVSVTHRHRKRIRKKPVVREQGQTLPRNEKRRSRIHHYSRSRLTRSRFRLYSTGSISNGHYHRLTWSIRHWHLKHNRLNSPSCRTQAWRIRRLFEHMPSARTTRLDLLVAHSQYVLPHLPNLLIQYSITTKTKSWKFRAFRHRQSALAFLVNRILSRPFGSSPPKHVIVAYGAAKFDPCSRGNAPSPNARIARALERLGKAKVVMMDEFRTSMLCSACHSQLVPHTHPPHPNNNSNSKGYHGVLQCPKRTCRAHLQPWNRDVNASINMANLLLFSISQRDPLQRPTPFTRGQTLPPTGQMSGDNPSAPSFHHWNRHVFSPLSLIHSPTHLPIRCSSPFTIAAGAAKQKATKM